MLDKEAKLKALQALMDGLDEDEMEEMKGPSAESAMMESSEEKPDMGVEMEKEMSPEGEKTSLEFENLTEDEKKKLMEYYSQLKG